MVSIGDESGRSRKGTILLFRPHRIENSPSDTSTPNTPWPGDVDSSGGSSPGSMSCQAQALDVGDKPRPRDTDTAADSTISR